MDTGLRYILKHALSLVLPVTVLIVVPWLLDRHAVLGPGGLLAGGLLLIAVGGFIIAQTIVMFYRIGKGTLAPWHPTRRLVVSGMYAYVRNPMILGVIIVLLGEALVFASLPILLFAVFVFLLNTVYFIFSEEPGLEKRFGEEYHEYKRHVPRWLPRLKPWRREG